MKKIKSEIAVYETAKNAYYPVPEGGTRKVSTQQMDT
jgi:hypothetical protein